MYSYHIALTKEEALESTKHDVESANRWWETLTDSEKILAEDMLGLMFKQRNCDHKWVNGKYYDMVQIRCTECDIKKD